MPVEIFLLIMMTVAFLVPAMGLLLFSIHKRASSLTEKTVATRNIKLLHLEVEHMKEKGWRVIEGVSVEIAPPFNYLIKLKRGT